MPEPVITGMTPLPTDPRPAIETLAAYMRGEITDTLELLHAGWDLEGYALRQFHDHPSVFAAKAEGVTAKRCVENILHEVGIPTGRGAPDLSAINWAALLPLVLQLIQILLSGTKP